MISVFWTVFIVSSMVFWKLFSDFAPVEEFAGLDIRFITGFMAVLAALGFAFSCHLIQKALQKEEEVKKSNVSEPRKKRQPKFDELYEAGEDANGG